MNTLKPIIVDLIRDPEMGDSYWPQLVTQKEIAKIIDNRLLETVTMWNAVLAASVNLKYDQNPYNDLDECLTLIAENISSVGRLKKITKEFKNHGAEIDDPIDDARIEHLEALATWSREARAELITRIKDAVAVYIIELDDEGRLAA